MALVTDCMRKGEFTWSKFVAWAFTKIKTKMTEALVIRLPDFSKVFEIACDASGIGIGVILSQEGQPITYFSEKLNKAKQKYSNYERKFYIVVQALKY